MPANSISQINNVQQAKAIISTVWVLAKALKWPLQQGATSGHAWWRGDSKPSLSIYDGGTRWTDHGTGQHGGVIDMLAVAEKLDNAGACRRFIAIARTLVAGGAVASPVRSATTPQTKRREQLESRTLGNEWRRGSETDLSALAQLRSLPGVEGLRWASDRGFLLLNKPTLKNLIKKRSTIHPT